MRVFRSLFTETGVPGAQRANAVLRSVSQGVALQQPPARTLPPALSLPAVPAGPLAQRAALAAHLPQRSVRLHQQHERRRRRREIDAPLRTQAHMGTRTPLKSTLPGN